MRFMVMVKATRTPRAGVMPSEELLTAMGKFNEELVKAGVMLAGEGLHPSSKGARVRVRGRQAHRHRRPVRRDQGADRRLLDLAGASRHGRGDRVGQARPVRRRRREIEIRQVFEAEDFGDEFTPELREQERRLRAQIEADSSESVRAMRHARPTSTAAIDAVWRIESARLIAGLARIVRDVGLAEDLAQDALVAALEQWPESGVPDNPGAWLMATAKHRAIDLLRRGTTARAQARGARPRARARSEVGRARPRRRARRRRRRRPAAPDLHRLPPGALDRGARRAHPAPARRPDDRRDRPRVPRPRADDRAAHRPRQADARRGARAVRGARAATSCAERLASVLEVDLPDLQRGLLGHRRATTGCAPRCARTRCGSAASWPSWRRTSPRCTAWSR